jgi:hypothetical protein
VTRDTASGTTEEAIDGMLQSGERRRGTVAVADATLVVTDRRLLVLREEGTPRQRAVDRANVGEIRVRTESDRGPLWLALQWAVLGVALVAAWAVVPFEGLVRPVSAPAGTGFEGLFALVNDLVGLFALLDEAFLLGGAAALGWGAVRLAEYALDRGRFLELTVTGADPIRLPAPADDTAVARLRELCGP